MERTIFTRIKKSAVQSGFLFWQAQPFKKRLETLECIRQEFISWKYAHKPRFQRVFTIIKRKKYDISFGGR
ncbi:hypothetical protein EH222_13325 [candidate division KSB1 bacterium]|nr:MAG: hypothetical protein EH222_13325 [candidate division KSB1 bacterium]